MPQPIAWHSRGSMDTTHGNNVDQRSKREASPLVVIAEAELYCHHGCGAVKRRRHTMVKLSVVEEDGALDQKQC